MVGRGAVRVGPQLCTHTVALVDERLASTAGWWAETLTILLHSSEAHGAELLHCCTAGRQTQYGLSFIEVGLPLCKRTYCAAGRESSEHYWMVGIRTVRLH